jgi:hypothetical protein
MRQRKGIMTDGTHAHGTTRSGTATSPDGGSRPAFALMIRVHTEVLALGGCQVDGTALSRQGAAVTATLTAIRVAVRGCG